MNIRPARIALILFAVALLALIALADSGHGRWLFRLASTVPGGDKIGHFVLFGVLSFLVNLVGQGRTLRYCGFQLLKGSLIVLALAVLEECSQVFFRTRTFDLLDLASDALGIWVFGSFAADYLDHKRKRLQQVLVVVRQKP